MKINGLRMFLSVVQDFKCQIFVENIFEKHVDWTKLIETDDNYKIYFTSKDTKRV